VIPLRGALWLLGAAVAAFLLWWGYGVYSSAQDAKLAQWKAKAEAAELEADSMKTLSARADTIYRQGETIYLRGRDVLLNPGPGRPPATAEVRACFALADSSRTLCQRRHDADTAALHATERELNLWKNKPSGVRRVQAYGEAMYDMAHQVPLIRVGATAKVFGPVHLSVAGEYAAPKAGSSDPAFRALAGLRINF
jgi:hypothetical protein